MFTINKLSQRSESRHRRKLTATRIWMENPTSTTKALAVVIVAPCNFLMPLNLVSDVEETLRIRNEYNHNLDVLNNVESCIHSSEIDPQSHDSEAITKEKQNLTDLKESQIFTPQETNQMDVNRVVNIEELLRMCFDKLALEWHLLNLPTYTMVRHLSQEDKLMQANGPKPQFAMRINDRLVDWIHMHVMVRPASLAIILDRVERIGVGTHCGTLTVLKAELCRTASPYAHQPPPEQMSTRTSVDNSSDIENAEDVMMNPNKSSSDDIIAESSVHMGGAEAMVQARAIEEAKAEWKNAATRLRIEQVREQIAEDAAFSFDFIALLSVASVLAGVGLIVNSVVVIVASMLVSPLMGPVLGLTFGQRIADWPLLRKSLLHEILALIICVVIGVLIGLCAGFTELPVETWPTLEMESRGQLKGLLTGIAVAFPSGMAVCLSLLGNNTNSLVGVAISASLLPPAVNTGVCLAYAFILNTGAVKDPESGKTAYDFVVIGAISFALTAINIVCIGIAGLVMFELKEVSPIHAKAKFSITDIKTVRELNQQNQHNRQVNVPVIRHGLKAALLRKRRENNTENNILRQPEEVKSTAASMPTSTGSPQGRKKIRKVSKNTHASDVSSILGNQVKEVQGQDSNKTYNDGSCLADLSMDDVSELLGLDNNADIAKGNVSVERDGAVFKILNAIEPTRSSSTL